MNLPEQSSRWRHLARWLAGTSTFLYVLSRFVPCQPLKHYGIIEDSWMQTLHVAFNEHLQFGRDIIFTCGPWGFLYGGYHPATHLVSVIVWSALSVVFWWTGWRIARHFFDSEAGSGLWFMAFIGTSGITIFLNIDVRLTAWVLLLFLMHFFVEERPFTTTQAVLTVSLGLLSLVKFNTFMLTLVIVLAIAADNVLRQRRLPWILPVLGASILFFWILAGQRLSSFGPFLRSSWQVAGGYTDAMMLTGIKEAEDVCYFLAAATLLCMLAGYAAWVRHRWLGTIPLAALCFTVFTAFKYGYVRHDGHEVTATMQLLLISLVCLAILWPVVRGKGLRVILSNFLPAMVVCFFAASTFRRYSETGLLTTFGRTLSIRNIFAPAELLREKGRLHEAYEQQLADFRNQFPLPQIEGNTDAYPWNQAAIFARGLPYRPRPVIQSYSAYTPELAELNAAYLRSDRAPKNILFETSTRDNHFPSLDDGLSWPELLTRYDIQNVEMPFVLLKRSAVPREFRLTPLCDIPLGFKEQIIVPPATNGPIWARIEINRNLRGAVISALYKPPILSLTVSLRDGRQLHYRLVPGMARSGFILSPLVEDSASFASLLSTTGSRDLKDSEVLSLSVSAKDQFQPSAYYQSPMRLRLYGLEYPRQDLGMVAGLQRLNNFIKAIRYARLLRVDYPPRVIYSPPEGTVLKVPPNSAIIFSLPRPPKRLKVGFGIHKPGSVVSQKANGITFRVCALDGQGQTIPLGSQHLDPANREAGRGTPQGVIDLEDVKSQNIVLETLSDDSKASAGGYGYWSEINFE
jgi:hypothetical protein